MTFLDRHTPIKKTFTLLLSTENKSSDLSGMPKFLRIFFFSAMALFLSVVNPAQGTELFDSWKKLDELGFSQSTRRNIDNLKQRNIIDQYADNIANASNSRKGNFGEIGADLDLNGKGYESLQTRIDDIDAFGHNGLDGVYRKDGQYFIVEGKYTGSASLNPANDATGLARQMSDDWIATRDWSNVNLEQGVIDDLLDTGNYKRILAKVAPDGSVSYKLIDADGYVALGNAGIFNP